MVTFAVAFSSIMYRVQKDKSNYKAAGCIYPWQILHYTWEQQVNVGKCAFKSGSRIAKGVFCHCFFKVSWTAFRGSYCDFPQQVLLRQCFFSCAAVGQNFCRSHMSNFIPHRCWSCENLLTFASGICGLFFCMGIVTFHLMLEDKLPVRVVDDLFNSVSYNFSRELLLFGW